MANPWTSFGLTSVSNVYGNSAMNWCNANPNDAMTPKIRASVATVPQALWFGPNPGVQWLTGYVSSSVAAKQLPVIVPYAIPNRDLGGYSAGGLATAAQYRAFIDTAAACVGSNPCVVVLEPDSLFLASVQPVKYQLQVIELLQYAVQTFAVKCPNTYVYLDAGDGYDVAASKIAGLLDQAGIVNAAGFALNVSNYTSTANCNSYAASINQTLNAYGVPTKPFVIDTSRNALGRPSQTYINSDPSTWWCNAPCQLGQRPDMSGHLWIKHPGESDGYTRSSQPSGAFDPALAYNM